MGGTKGTVGLAESTKVRGLLSKGHLKYKGADIHRRLIRHENQYNSRLCPKVLLRLGLGVGVRVGVRVLA